MTVTLVDLFVLSTGLIILALVHIANRKERLRGLRQPKGEGFLLGVEHQLKLSARFGDLTFKWAKKYGATYKIPGCFGEPILVTSDPQAIHRIFHQHVVEYPASKDFKRFFKLLFGPGIIWVTGDEHKRHRRVLSPAFSISHMKSFLPLFQQHASQLVLKWNAELGRGNQTIDVVPWLHKVTLDVIGESSFNYRFEAIEDKQNEVTDALHALESLSIRPSRLEILMQAIPRYLPDAIGDLHAKYFPTDLDKASLMYLDVSWKKAREAMQMSGLTVEGNSEEKSELTGKERDVLSVLVKANRAEDPRRRLTEDEVLAQMSTLI